MKLSKADAQFLSATPAIASLCEGSAHGKRKPREREEVEWMLAAARTGIEMAYYFKIKKEYDTYLASVDSAIRNLRPPSFTEPPIGPPSGEASERWVDIDRAKRVAREMYEFLSATIKLRAFNAKSQHELANIATIPDFEEFQEGFRRDADQVLMTAYILWEARLCRFREPMPLELALFALAVGLEPPITVPPKAGDSERKRRDKWGHTLERGRQYARKMLFIPGEVPAP